MYTRAKKIGGKVMAGGENRMIQPAAPRCGQVAQVDRFVADVVEKDTIHIHQRSLVVQTVMARVPSDVASVMVRVPPRRPPTAPLATALADRTTAVVTMRQLVI